MLKSRKEENIKRKAAMEEGTTKCSLI